MVKTLEEIERAHRRTAAYAQYEYVDVVFGAAGVDVVVPHILHPGHPEDINYEVVKTDAPCQVFHDGSSTRRPWSAGYIVLRSDVANVQVRLLLSAERAGIDSGVAASVPRASTPPVAPGDWVHVPFDAGNYTANGTMTWTVDIGDQVTLAYTRNGSTMTVAWYLNQTSVGGTLNTQLRIALPDGAIAAQSMATTTWFSNAGLLDVGLAQVEAGATFIQIFRRDLVNWAASTNTTAVRGQLAFETQ